MEKFFNNIKFLIEEFRFIDILDILLVSIIIYYIVKFIRERRASKLATGVVIVLAVLIVSLILEMRAMSFLLSNVVQIGLIALVILFQPELRAALEKVGSSSFKTFKNTISKEKGIAESDNIANICQAVSELAREYTGALIIIERNTP